MINQKLTYILKIQVDRTTWIFIFSYELILKQIN